ncbi:MAG: leucine--tRNA ligase [Chitinophagales bacterium]|nr:leucine--tRNA ligase [Chitinophagales bacterium]
MEFDFRRIEEEYRKYWIENEVYTVTEDSTKPKYYVLDMFPYPSGAGLHVGHPLGYVASDIFSRYKRMKGFNVLHPMGFDAFGLPAEQYAIETGTHPQITTDKAIATYKEQLAKIGFSYDWTREVKTCDPDYYKWTQWIFLQLFDSWYNKESNKAEKIETLLARFEKENRTVDVDGQPKQWNLLTEDEKQMHLMHYRLAFQSYTEVNWCDALGCVLANDEVKDGKSERGGFPIERRKMKQWSLRITAYADRLLEGLETLEWSESMKEMQRNWIGRSEGALIDFKVKDREDFIKVFTTRADTIFGATFLVLSPEHELVEQLVTAEQKSTIDEYVAYVKSRSDVERQQEKKVTGAFTGAYALNPFNGTSIPIYIAEYVLAGYGTGAIMAVPADDERDKKFAEKFGLPVIEVIDKSMYPGATIEDKLGKMINSEFLNGMEVKDAIAKMLDEVESRNIGSRKVNYKLRDASFSRQRYWGEPIPVKYKVVGEPDSPLKGESDDIPYALSASELPLVLPEVDSFKPSGDGRSPLANNADWVAKNYETDTMPGYAGSSWYFLRYMDPKNKEAFAAKDKLDYWQNVDLYLGGNEHAVGHLLYARLWTKVLFDLGYLPFDEPFKKLVNQGMIQGVSNFLYRIENENKFVSSSIVDGYLHDEVKVDSIRTNIEFVDNKYELDVDAFIKWRPEYKDFDFERSNGAFHVMSVVEKMSKSKYNVVNPDDVIATYGADCFRMFEMFLGPIEQSKPWDDKGISGVSSFLRKFWRLFYSETAWKVTDETPTDKELKVLHKTIKKINEDVEKMSFNTSVSQFMITVNELQDLKCSKRAILEPLVLCLAPFAPFITEELWKALGNKGSVHKAAFPALEEKYLVESEFEYPVSINGKTRASIALPADISQEDALAKVMEIEMVQKWMEGKPVKKFVFVKGRIVNIVV